MNEKNIGFDELREIFVDRGLDTFENIFQIEDIFYMLNTNGDIIYVNDNAVEVTGYSKDEIYSKDSLEFFVPEDRQRVEKNLKRTLKNGSTKADYKILTKDNREIPYEFKTIRITDKNGDILGCTGLGRNISDRVKKEQRLEVLTRTLRHDISTIANILITNTEFLKNYNIQDNQYTNTIDTLVKNSNRLVDISNKSRKIQDIIQKGEYKKEKIDITEIIQESIESFRKSHTEAKIKTDIPDSLYVYTNKIIVYAIDNLIENAIQHNDKQTPIVKISINKNIDYVTIEISDNGPGIPQDQIDVLQSGKETDLEHLDGLGLWVVYWIIKEIDANINFENGKKEGSKISITLKK